MKKVIIKYQNTYGIVLIVVIFIGIMGNNYYPRKDDEDTPELPHSKHVISLYNSIVSGVSSIVSASVPPQFNKFIF